MLYIDEPIYFFTINSESNDFCKLMSMCIDVYIYTKYIYGSKVSIIKTKEETRGCDEMIQMHIYGLVE